MFDSHIKVFTYMSIIFMLRVVGLCWPMKYVAEREEGEESNWGCANEEGQKTSSIIWGVGSRFGTNTMKAWIHLGLYGYFRVLVVVLWFGDHFGDFGLLFFLAKCWFSCHSLLENCCRPCPSLQDHSIPIFFQQDNTPCHKAQLV